MQKIIYFYAILLFPAFGCLSSDINGISLNQTRIIITDKNSVHNLVVTNRGDKRYLLQSRIYDDEQLTKTAGIIFTPPIIVLKEHSQQILRVVKSGVDLPTDRESVFYSAVTAIPAVDQRKDASSEVLSMGMRFVIKLFYRPDGLDSENYNLECSLRFEKSNNGFSIKNPTPYYQTIGKLYVNGKEYNLDAMNSMVSPFGGREYRLDSNLKSFRWNTLSDYGVVGKMCFKSILKTGR